MTTVHVKNLLAAIGLVALLLLVLIALFLPSANQTLARADETSNGSTQLSATNPISIPLVHPVVPIGSAKSELAQSGGQPPTHTNSIHAIPFRPQVRLQRGALPPDFQLNAAKQARPTGKVKSPLNSPKPSTPHPPSEANQVLSNQGWSLLGYEGFEGTGFPSSIWHVYDFGDDGYDRTWGTTDYRSWVGNQSAWPAAGGTNALDPWYDWYSDNLYSWMEYGPVDLSSMYDVFLDFGLYYDTEPDYDKIYLCISVDFYNYSCTDYWSGYSDGWQDQNYWLTSYAGYPQVWFAWVFISDSSVSQYYDGPFVDDISIWGNDIPPTPPVPTCTLDGQLIQNCGFETGNANNWSISSGPYQSAVSTLALQPESHKRGFVPDAQSRGGQPGLATIESVNSVVITNVAPAEGTYHALMSWSGSPARDSLYQQFNIPSGVSSVTVNYWYGVTTYETVPGYDFFCASLQTTSGSYLVDLGCMDAVDTDAYWHEYVYTLSGAELSAVRGRAVRIVFDLYNDDSLGSYGWVDFVRVYAAGGTVASIDPNEPNNDFSTATTLACSQTISSGIIGDAVGGTDVDLFKISNVPAGRLTIDIDARTQAPQSDLDSVVYLYNNNHNVVAYNDDDGLTLDSYVGYTNTTAGATYYARVSSYTGEGGPDSFYAIKAACNTQGEQHGGTTPPAGITGTWTVMLYLNAEDSGFANILTKYRTDIEKFIVGKRSFLTVTILYDPPGSTGITRYVVQPNGNYTTGVNRWNLAEANMGDPDTLSNFVSWSMDQFPADNYYLAIDDHGNGAYGISFDATSLNDPLTPPEVYSALKAATQNGARKIDILDYEACLMGLAENAYDVKSLVHYFVASEQISWGINTYPTYFNDLTANTPPLTVGQRIVTRYSATASAAGYPHTMALIDTTQLGTVNTAINGFATALMATGNYTAALTARAKSQAFAADAEATDSSHAEYIDLWSLADHAQTAGMVSSSIANTVKSAVSSAVVVERHVSGMVDGIVWDHNGAHGLSIYYPATRLSAAFAPYIAGSIYRMSADGRWDEFLQWSLPGTQRGMHGTRASFRLTGGTTFIFKQFVYLPLLRK